ncbi:Uncharacterized protein PPKH_4339 [Pseudomonas putida]|nr:Uncharacterized protein PPKH_4339 [Pseudomonas putida]
MRRIRPVLACYWVNWRNGLFFDSLHSQRVLPSGFIPSRRRFHSKARTTLEGCSV